MQQEQVEINGRSYSVNQLLYIGKLYVTILSHECTLMAHASVDGTNSVTVVNTEGKRKTSVRDDPASALAAILDAERKKRCTACGETKAFSAFARNADKPDGKNGRCLECERQRVKGYYDRRKGKSTDGEP